MGALSQCFLFQPLSPVKNTFVLEVQPAEDPAPEFIHIFGNCFLVSTTTNSSLQEAKNSVTSCLTVSLARTHDSVETAAVVLLMHRYEKSAGHRTRR